MSESVSRYMVVAVLVLVSACYGKAVTPEADTIAAQGSKAEILPIASYDSNTGYGGGIKAFLLNELGANESFDAVVFASTKGERWCRLVLSVPDFERRQGRIYPIAIDAFVDYDIQTRYGFFGVGPNTSFSGRINFRRETWDLGVTANRGFSREAVVQAGVHYRSVRNSGYPEGSILGFDDPSGDSFQMRYLSLLAVLRFDSRLSYINPWQGVVLQCEAERSLAVNFGNSFTRLGGWAQCYLPVADRDLVLALRAGVQSVLCDNPPVPLLLSIGGGWTVRGYAQDRYLDKSSAVANAELRFPVYWRFAGAVGYDAGVIWHSFGKGPGQAAGSPMAGLRFIFDTFITRLDVGFGPEDVGLYLNFGQLF